MKLDPLDILFSEFIRRSLVMLIMLMVYATIRVCLISVRLRQVAKFLVVVTAISLFGLRVRSVVRSGGYY